MDAPLILIASYPKSGNTWVRAVIQGLLTPEHAGDINRIDIGLYGHARRRLFDYYAPAEAADLTPDEVELLLPSVWEDLAADAKEPIFVKVHDRARKTASGEWLFPPDAVRQVIYLVRHPFDVAASFSNHLGISIEETVNILCGKDPDWFRAESKLPLTLQETDGSWSENVRSWTEQELPYPVLCMRYEDLQDNEIGSFRRIAKVLDLPTDYRLTRAIESANMTKLKFREQADGFRERPSTSSSFFRQGGKMTWRTTLTQALRKDLIQQHAYTMHLLGYTHEGETSHASLLSSCNTEANVAMQKRNV